MKKAILILITSMASASFASTINIRTSAVVGERGKSVNVQMQNTAAFDAICEGAALEMEIYQGGNREFISAETEFISPLYAPQSESLAQHTPLIFESEREDSALQYVGKVALNISPSCWRKASFAEYCEFAEHSAEEVHVIDKLMSTTRDGGCKQIEAWAAKKITLRRVGLESFEPFKYFPKLKKLYVQENNLSSIEGIDQLTGLETLDISENPIVDFTPLAGLLKLKTLRIKSSQIDSLDFVREMKNLKTLDLTGSKIKDLSPLEGLSIGCVRLKKAELAEKDISRARKIVKRNRLGCR